MGKRGSRGKANGVGRKGGFRFWLDCALVVREQISHVVAIVVVALEQ